MNEERLNKILDKRFAESEARLVKLLDEKLNEQLAQFFGRFTDYFDKKFKDLEERTDKRFDDVYKKLDAISARLDTETTERNALESRVSRHESWVGQLAKHTGAKLQPKITN